GNWELAGLPFAILRLKPTAIYKRMTNPYVDRYVRSHRERLHSGGMLPMRRGIMESVAVRDTLRRLISSIRNGHSIGFLADHHDRRGTLVPFFGHAVRATRVPAMLARHFGGRMLVGRIVRLSRRSRFLLEINEIEVPRTADRSADVRRATVAVH